MKVGLPEVQTINIDSASGSQKLDFPDASGWAGGRVGVWACGRAGVQALVSLSLSPSVSVSVSVSVCVCVCAFAFGGCLFWVSLKSNPTATPLVLVVPVV